MRGLLFISLSRNPLQGSIPPELSNLRKLQAIVLEDCQLSGIIPPELGQMTSLEALILSKNQLEGPIPSELGALSSLKSLYLRENKLSGSLPDLGVDCRWFTLDVAWNDLSGPVPHSLLQCTSWHVTISHNPFLHFEEGQDPPEQWQYQGCGLKFPKAKRPRIQ